MVREMQEGEQRQQQQKYVMGDEERKQLIDALKKKWEVLNHDYEAIITRVTKTNPLGLVREKERLEREMAQIEKDIQRLSTNCPLLIDPTR